MGEERVVRLLDRVSEAKRNGPDLERAYKRIRRHFRKNVDPYSGLTGRRTHSRLVVGFARPAVTDFLAGKPLTTTPTDPGPKSGMSDARASLFLPAPTSMSFDVTLPRKGRLTLEMSVGVVPAGAGGSVTFKVFAEAEEKKLAHTETVPPNGRGIWHPVKVDLTSYAGKRIVLSLETRGRVFAGAVVARPEIWASRGCRPGPNIVFLVPSSVRADAVGAYSGRAGVTPALDALAKESTVFERAYSLASWTRPSMVALFAAEWAGNLGFFGKGFRLKPKERAQAHQRLAPRLATLHLARLGYRTFAVGDNPFFLAHTPLGLDHGLGRVVDIRHGRLEAPAAVKVVEQFLETNQRRPFFLWVSLAGGRPPFWPPRGFRVKGARPPGAPGDTVFEKYLGEVRWADRHMGKILEALAKGPHSRETIVVATSDHGEVFADAHSYNLSGIQTRYRHSWSLYDEVVRVPLMVRGPGVKEGKTIKDPVSHRSLLPAILEMANLPPPP